MKTHPVLAAALGAFLAVAPLVAASRRVVSVNANEADALDSLAWMAGDWETATQRPTSKSIELAPPAGPCSAITGPSETAK